MKADKRSRKAKGKIRVQGTLKREPDLRLLSKALIGHIRSMTPEQLQELDAENKHKAYMKIIHEVAKDSH